MSGAVGGNKSGSSSKFKSDVWAPQGGALENLYNAAEGLFGNQGMFSGILNSLAGQITPGMQNISNTAQQGMQNLTSGGSVGDTSEIRNQLLDSLRTTSGGSNLGRMYSSIVGGSGNEYIDPMVEAMKNSSMDNLNRMQSSTAMDAAASGQAGSSRHAMQNAMLARDANRDMLDREMAMRGGAYDKDLSMKLDIARQADQGIQNSQAQLMNMLSMADANTNAGINSGANVQGIGMGTMAPWMQAMQAPWMQAQNYSNIIGAPTILGSGKSGSSGKGAGASASLFG